MMETEKNIQGTSHKDTDEQVNIISKTKRILGYRKKGKFWGISENYHGNGQLLSSHPFENGRLQGEVLCYDACGRLENKIPYQDGLPHGFAEFYVQGTPSMYTYFYEGKHHGETTLFYRAGGIREQIQYEHGVKQGRSISYDSFGRVKQVAHYHNGLLEGPVIIYSSDGSLKESGAYLQGRRHGEFIVYDGKDKAGQVHIFDMGQRL